MSFYWSGQNLASGDEYANAWAFAAIKEDGSVVTWGHQDYGGNSSGVDFTGGVQTIFSNVNAFAALKNDGSVVTWGYGASGGDSSAVAAALSSDVCAVFSTPNAFAALKSDGSVVTWGDQSTGGNSASAIGLENVVAIFSNDGAFAALKDDGSVVTWGDADYGGNSSAVHSELSSDVTYVFSNARAFAAIKSDGSVVTWGDPVGGGDSDSVQADLAGGVYSITSNGGAFAALKDDGSVVTWGEAFYGGNSSSVAAALSSGVVAVFATESSFAALKDDGSVVTWGVGSGGDSSAVAGQLSSGVVMIWSTQGAYAALKDDGSIVTWGDSAMGGNSSGVSGALVDVYAIYANSAAFAALTADGALVTWGNAAKGGDSSAVPPEFCGCVYNIYATPTAFAILMVDGQVFTWGDASAGGDSSGVALELASGIIVLDSIDDCAPPPLCYVRGTMVLTDQGERPVETLRPGDTVATHLGGFRAIRWIGQQRHQGRQVPPAAAPILIRAGALGEGIPRRDLQVAPYHSMLLDGRLIYAERLVNGITIVRQPPPAELHYYQLDLGDHDCVLAEGAWSESFADFPGGRAAFDNAAEHALLFPDYQPPAKVETCRPRPEQGPELESALLPVLARAMAAAGETGRLKGAIDRIGATGDGQWRVNGWALDDRWRNLPQVLDVVLDGVVVGTTVACNYRWDLARAALRRGWCSFTLRVPGTISPEQAMRLVVRRAADQRELTKTRACIDGILGLPANTDAPAARAAG